METKYKLTGYSHTGGCAAKLPPDMLESILKDMEIKGFDSNLITGNANNEDAAVYRLNDSQAIISTVDFFPPMVDDPYIYGQIAAANALSDVYAMGGRPILALNLLCTPCGIERDCIRRILEGAASKVSEAGAVTGGGHSIADKEIKFGLSVNGLVDVNKIWTNSGLRPGDSLVLTKPLGAGIYSVALRGGLLSEKATEEMITNMTRLNKKAKEVAEGFEVHGCTDITGFGLILHALEMAKASEVCIQIEHNRLPLMSDVVSHTRNGMLPAATYTNENMMKQNRVSYNGIPGEYIDIMLAPETSGGLLLGMERREADEYVKTLSQSGIACAIIGEVTELADNYIYVI